MRAWEYSRRGEWRQGKGHGPIKVIMEAGELLARPAEIPADRYVHNEPGRAEVRGAQMAEIGDLGDLGRKLKLLRIKLPIRL